MVLRRVRRLFGVVQGLEELLLQYLLVKSDKMETTGVVTEETATTGVVTDETATTGVVDADVTGTTRVDAGWHK